jgi:hypothetical protein
VSGLAEEARPKATRRLLHLLIPYITVQFPISTIPWIIVNESVLSVVFSPVYVESNHGKNQVDPAYPGTRNVRRILLTCKSFRINTYKRLAKQATLTTFGMNTYAKKGGGLIVNQPPTHLPGRKKSQVGANPNGRRLQARRQDVDDGDGQQVG